MPIVLCGEDPDPKPNFNYRVVDGLGYADHNQPSQITGLELAKRMRVALEGLEGHPPPMASTITASVRIIFSMAPCSNGASERESVIAYP